MYLANIAKEQGDLATSLEMERNYSAYLDSIQNSRYPYEIIDAENKQQIIQQKKNMILPSTSTPTFSLFRLELSSSSPSSL